MRIHRLHHYNPRTSGFVLKIKKWCWVSMSHHGIHHPWPSIYWKRYDSTLQIHLKAINGIYPSCGKEDKNSTLRGKLLWRNYSLHIESAFLFPFKSKHIIQPPDTSLLDWEPHCLSYMSLPLVENWSGGGPTGRDLVSWFRTVSTRKFVIHSLMLITF